MKLTAKIKKEVRAMRYSLYRTNASSCNFYGKIDFAGGYEQEKNNDWEYTYDLINDTFHKNEVTL